MSPIQSIIRSISISADEIGIVESVRDRLAEIGRIDEKCRPDPHQWNKFAWLHFEMERLANELAESPSQAAAEAVHFATTRLRDAGQSIEAIAGSLRVAGDRIRSELAPVITAIFDKASEKLAVEIETRRAQITKGGGTVVFDIAAEISAFDGRSAQLLAHLEGERQSAMASPLEWLTNNGIGVPEVLEPTAKPAAAPVKNFRGKVAMPAKEPEAPTDVLSELADDDDDGPEDPLSLLAGN